MNSTASASARKPKEVTFTWSRGLKIDSHSVMTFHGSAMEFVAAWMSQAAAKGHDYLTAAMTPTPGTTGSRALEKALPRRWLPFDFDYVSSEEAEDTVKAYFSKYQHITYRTSSWSEENRKFRLILILDRECDTETCCAVGAGIANELIALVPDLRVDHSVFMNSQPVFCALAGVVPYFELDRPPIDVDTAPRGKAPVQALNGGKGSGWRGLLYELKDMKRDASGRIPESDGTRHALLRRYAMSLSAGGMDLDEVQQRLEEVARDNFTEDWFEAGQDRPSGHMEIRRRAKTIHNKVRRERQIRDAKYSIEPGENPIAADHELIADLEEATPTEYDDLLTDIETDEALDPREWTVQGLLPIGYYSALVSPGAGRKSGLLTLLGCCIATGTDFGPFKVREPRKVLLITYEDAPAEYVRKRRALSAAWRFNAKLLKENFKIMNLATLGIEGKLTDVRFGKTEPTGVAMKLALWMLEHFQAEQIIIETAAMAHGGMEDNPGLTALSMSLKGMAQELHANVLASQHVSKEVARNKIADQHAGRGGSSFSDNAKSVIQLVGLDDDVAKRLWPTKQLERLDPMNCTAMMVTKSSFAPTPEPCMLLTYPAPDHESYGLKFYDVGSAPERQLVEQTPSKKEITEDTIDGFMSWFLKAFPKGASGKMLSRVKAHEKPTINVLDLVKVAEACVAEGLLTTKPGYKGAVTFIAADDGNE